MDPPPPTPSTPPAPWSRAQIVAAAVAAVLLVVGLRANGWSPTDLIARPLSKAPATSLIWEGDSQSASAPGVVTTADAVVEDLGRRVFAQTFASGGAVLDTLEARARSVDSQIVSFGGTRNVLVAWAGSNDLGFGKSPEDVHDRYAAYAKHRQEAGWTVVVATALPRQYLGDVPGYEERRLAYNELLRDDWRDFADVLVDVGADPQIGDPAANAVGRFYSGDLTHLNDAGRRIAAARFAEALAANDLD